MFGAIASLRSFDGVTRGTVKASYSVRPQTLRALARRAKLRSRASPKPR
jgi:hypothetical protein